MTIASRTHGPGARDTIPRYSATPTAVPRMRCAARIVRSAREAPMCRMMSEARIDQYGWPTGDRYARDEARSTARAARVATSVGREPRVRAVRRRYPAEGWPIGTRSECSATSAGSEGKACSCSLATSLRCARWRRRSSPWRVRLRGTVPGVRPVRKTCQAPSTAFQARARRVLSRSTAAASPGSGGSSSQKASTAASASSTACRSGPWASRLRMRKEAAVARAQAIAVIGRSEPIVKPWEAM